VAFANVPEPEVVTKVSGELAMARAALVLPEQRAAFDRFAHTVLRPGLTRTGLRPVATEPIHVAPLRASLLRQLGTNEAADPEIVEVARDLTETFLADPRQVDPSLAGAVLDVATYQGDAGLYERLLASLQKPNTPATRELLIVALGGFHNPTLAGRALAFSLAGALNSTEFLRVAAAAATDPDLQPMVMAWVMANYDAIKAKAPERATASLISYGELAEPSQFERYRAFLLDPARTFQLAEKNAIKAADRVGLRALLREREGARVEAFLKSSAGKPGADR
jgi:hypothetical protein